MDAINAIPAGSPAARFLQAVEAWCARIGMSAGALGAAALGDRDFVPSLLGGRNPRLRTVDRVLSLMGEPPAGPAFLGEVEAFLSVTGICSNGRGIRRAVIEERVLAGLRDKLMAPEAAAEAMRAYAEETNRLNRERRASGASDRKELADIDKKIATMVAAIEDGG